jgi:hypothetical protein
LANLIARPRDVSLVPDIGWWCRIAALTWFITSVMCYCMEPVKSAELGHSHSLDQQTADQRLVYTLIKAAPTQICWWRLILWMT